MSVIKSKDELIRQKSIIYDHMWESHNGEVPPLGLEILGKFPGDPALRQATEAVSFRKNKPTMNKFDIVSFYPSITLRLLRKSIAFAKRQIQVKKEVFETILNERKSFLFHKDEPWIKKNTNEQIDVTELVGLYLLHKLQRLFTNNSSVGLYRDDGLAVVKIRSCL